MGVGKRKKLFALKDTEVNPVIIAEAVESALSVMRQ